MKRFRDVGFRSIAAIVIAAFVAGCSGGSAQSPLPSTSTVSSLPASQPVAQSAAKAQASGIAAFVIPAVNGAAYNVAQWSSVEFPASHSTVFVGTDSYNNVAYSFTVTSDPTTGYFMFSTSNGMYAVRANSAAQVYTASRGSNPTRDMNILNALKFDMVDAELGGGGSGGGPGGRNPAAEKSAASQPQPIDVLIKGLVLVGAVAAFGGALLAVPALIVAVSATVAVIAVAATGAALLAAALDYANTLGAFDQDNGPAPTIDPPSSNGPPSVSDFCRPIVYEGIAGLDCTFYY